MDLRSNAAPPSLALITMFLNALTIAKLYCKGKVYDVSKVFWTMAMTKMAAARTMVMLVLLANSRDKTGAQWERWER